MVPCCADGRRVADGWVAGLVVVARAAATALGDPSLSSPRRSERRRRRRRRRPTPLGASEHRRATPLLGHRRSSVVVLVVVLGESETRGRRTRPASIPRLPRAMPAAPVAGRALVISVVGRLGRPPNERTNERGACARARARAACPFLTRSSSHPTVPFLLLFSVSAFLFASFSSSFVRPSASRSSPRRTSASAASSRRGRGSARSRTTTTVTP